MDSRGISRPVVALIDNIGVRFGIATKDEVMTTGFATDPRRSAKRQLLRTKENLIFVDAYEFRRLAISTRKLVRADESDAGLRGLQDLDTGERFVTEVENLFQA